MSFRIVVMLAALCVAIPAVYGVGNAVSQETACATKVQAAVTSALEELKFKAVKSGRPGGDQQYEPTPEMVQLLKGKVVVVGSEGKVTVKPKAE